MKKTLCVSLMALIALFVVCEFSYADDLEKIQQVKRAIVNIEAGLGKYRIGHDEFPPDGIENLINAVYPGYLPFLENINGSVLIDPWGKPYIYERYDPGDNLHWHTYVIYSVGPNGADECGWGDDIGNWEKHISILIL